MKENRGKQSMRTMENEKLRVQISDHGAELCSIYDKEADREAVWIGDPASGTATHRFCSRLSEK